MRGPYDDNPFTSLPEGLDDTGAPDDFESPFFVPGEQDYEVNFEQADYPLAAMMPPAPGESFSGMDVNLWADEVGELLERQRGGETVDFSGMMEDTGGRGFVAGGGNLAPTPGDFGFRRRPEFGGWGQTICSVACPEGGASGEGASTVCSIMCPGASETADALEQITSAIAPGTTSLPGQIPGQLAPVTDATVAQAAEHARKDEIEKTQRRTAALRRMVRNQMPKRGKKNAAAIAVGVGLAGVLGIVLLARMRK